MLMDYLFELTQFSFFHHRLFRAGAAALFGIFFVFLLMPPYIRYLDRLDASSDFTDGKTKSPSVLGGLLIVLSVVFATLMFTKLNAFVISILIILVAYTVVGGIDDLMKIRNKRLIAKGEMTKKEFQLKADGLSARLRLFFYLAFSLGVAYLAYRLIPGLTGYLTVPFVKPEIWYPYLPNWAFIPLICLVITSTANGANFTDGLDTLVSVPLITCAIFIGVVAYVSGSYRYSDYFLIPFIPGVDELFPICAAIVGSLLAYLWYNCPPAEIYMGDGGSIGLGGAIGMMFVLIKAPLFLPIVGVIFLYEAVSVVLQIGGFKLTRKLSADGVGRRIFLRAPVHDHYKIMLKDKYTSPFQINSKVIWRFHLISILGLIVGTLIFFKVR